MANEMTCVVQTYDDYAQRYDADKEREGLQIDLSRFGGDYKGVKIWEDNDSCVGPDMDMLNLSGDDRKRVYKELTEYKGSERSAIFGKFRSNFEDLRKTSWFKTGYIDYERTTQDGKVVEWCSKGPDDRHCISTEEYLKLRSYFDLLDSTAQIIAEELKTP